MNDHHPHSGQNTEAFPQCFAKETPQCFNCHHPVYDNALHLSDGRWICSTCQPSVVRSQWQIDWVFTRVKDLLLSVGIELPTSVYVRIDNSASLNSLRNCPGNTLNFVGLSASQIQRSSNTIVRQRHRVNMLNGLHRAYFAGVLAHELLHVWQNAHDIELEPQLCEGFCEMGCYLMLKHIDTPLAHSHIRLMLLSSDPVYGEGFRQMKERFERLTRQDLPTLMRATLAEMLYSNLHGNQLRAALAKHQL